MDIVIGFHVTRLFKTSVYLTSAGTDESVHTSQHNE